MMSQLKQVLDRLVKVAYSRLVTALSNRAMTYIAVTFLTIPTYVFRNRMRSF
jgi:hypothetical protein